VPVLDWPTAEIEVEVFPPVVYAAPLGSGASPALWEAGVYDRYGTLLHALTVYDASTGTRECLLGKITRRVNAWATAEIWVVKTDADALAAIKPWTTELHIYRNGVLEFVGPFDRGRTRSTADGARKFTASGLERYFDIKVQLGDEVVEAGLLKNPTFAAGFDHWNHAPDATVSGGTVTLPSMGSNVTQEIFLTDFLPRSLSWRANTRPPLLNPPRNASANAA